VKEWRVIYSTEVEIVFGEDEMKSVEDLQGFFEYMTREESIDSWIRESVRDGNFEVKQVRIEEMKR
jgi:hypothetical protein